jgi:ribose 5-phosphate isomerase B
MQIGIGSDHAGFQLKEVTKAFLVKMGHQVRDFGTDSDRAVDYPLFVRPVAEAVRTGAVTRGVVLGGSGNGEAMVANRMSGIRCALCWDLETARLARAHNDANMLSLGARLLDENEALEIVKTWLQTPFEGGRHLRRIAQMDEIGPRKGMSDGSKQPQEGAPGDSGTSWDVLIAFRYILYNEGNNRIEFQVDPGLKRPSVIHIPGEARWDRDLPAWVRGRRSEIVGRIKDKCIHLAYEINEY